MQETGKTDSSPLAVAVPFYRVPLDADEEVSLASFRRHLGGYPLYFVTPEHLRLPDGFVRKNERQIAFPDSHFHDIGTYNRLLLSAAFYRAFSRHEFLLVGQLDALVLSGEAAHWCRRGWDYIGAPWGDNYRTGGGVELTGVGNGGFSMRRVSSALRVLSAPMPAHADYSMGPPPKWWYWRRVRRLMLGINWLRRFLPPISAEAHLRKYYSGNEDVFWGVHAAKVDPSFRVAPVGEAIRFAFESDPSGCYERSGRQLPFGCHAWTRYDRPFWEKVLEAGSENREDQ